MFPKYLVWRNFLFFIFTIFWTSMEKAQRLLFLLQKKEVWLFTLIQISFGEKRKNRGKGIHLHKEEESGLFLLYPVLISFLVSNLVFSKLGNFVAVKDCRWEGWAVIPPRHPPGVPGSVSLSELSVGGVCEYVNSGISSSDVLQWEIFFWKLEQGSKCRPTTPGSIYQNHIYYLRSKLLQWIDSRFISCCCSVVYNFLKKNFTCYWNML